jgi:hypothetical protein
MTTDDIQPDAQTTEPDIQPNTRKFGARVYLHSDGVALVKQTVKRGSSQNAPYVVDGQRERFVDPGDDAALGAAVRAALEGRL